MAFKGGKEILGLCIYHILSLLLFLSTRENGVPVSTPQAKSSGIEFPLFAFLALSAVSAIHSIFTQMQGGVHFATILIHTLNFYSLARISDPTFTNRFFTLTAVVSVILSFGIFGQLLFSEIETFFFPNRNLLASFLNCSILILLCRVSQSFVPRNEIWLLWMSLGLVLLTQLFLFSRGALFALFCGLLFLLLVGSKRIKLLLCSLIAFISIFALLIPQFRKMITSKLSASPSDTRLAIYQTALHAFLKKPMLGWGLGSFGQVYEQFKLPIESEIARYEKTTAFAHNEFLELLLETGILGLGCFLWLIFSILKAGWDSLKKSWSWEKMAAFSCLISLFSHALLEFNLHLPILCFLLIACTATLVAPSPSPKDAGSYPILKLAASIWILVSLAVLLSEISALQASSAREKGNHQRAMQFYRVATFLNPFFSKNFYELAHLSEGLSKATYLEKASKLSPGNSSFHRDLGLTYFQQGKTSQAILQYQKAIEKNPKKVFYYGELAQIYLFSGEMELAHSLLEEAIRIEPLYLWAHQKLAEIYLHSKNKNLAEKHFAAIKKIQDSNLNPSTEYSQRLLSGDPSP